VDLKTLGYATASGRVYAFCLPLKDVSEVEEHVKRLDWYCAELDGTQIAPGTKLLVVSRERSEVDALQEGGKLAATGYDLRQVGAGVVIGMLSAFAFFSAG
jgi:hypothetical protein